VRYGPGPYIKQTCLVFKRLNVTKGLLFIVFAQNFIRVTNVRVFYLNYLMAFFKRHCRIIPSKSHRLLISCHFRLKNFSLLRLQIQHSGNNLPP